MSEPDTGKGIPEEEMFSTSAEWSDFSHAIHFDPHVKKAEEVMEAHEPVSHMDALLDEYSAALKVEKPNEEAIQLILEKIQKERIFFIAQAGSERTANDQQETQELNDREQAINEIFRLNASISGLEKEIWILADTIKGSNVDSYPDAIQNIIDDALSENLELDVQMSAILRCEIEEVEDVVHDQTRLLTYQFSELKLIFAFMTKAEHVMIDDHSKMLKATSDWREKHKQV